MSAFHVVWHKTWEGRPICDPATCKHECGEQLSINQRLEKWRNGRQIKLDGIVCMDCGTDTTGHFTIAEVLRLCMDQHGWNRDVGLRLHDLAAAHEDELMSSPAIPLWCLHAFGWSGREIVDALNAGTLKPTRMSEEVERLAPQVNWQNAYDRSAA